MITFVYTDDWEAMYVDGELKLEGSTLSTHRVLKALGIVFESKQADIEWAHEVGNLPDRLEDVRFE